MLQKSLGFFFALVLSFECRTATQITKELNPKIFANPAFRKASKPVVLEPEKEGGQSGRVIGGKEANPGEVPYQVAIMLKDIGIWCGGSIYSPDTVISAAHCFFTDGARADNGMFVFVAGKTNLSKIEASEQLSEVESVHVHPEYNANTGVNDLAIVKLKTPFCFNKHVQPIPLIGPGITPSGKGWVSGWGYTAVRQFQEKIEQFSEKFSKTLKLTTLVLLEKATCVAKYSKVPSDLYQALSKDSSVICAEAVTGSDDACQGDSGGPLACLANGDTRTLCGVISCGRGCGLPDLPAFYTHLSMFHSWILSTAGTAGASCTE